MPPKAEAGAGNEAFLVACIKCAKAKLEVDFDAIAKATGMSKGGASNKFRSIMKQFEDEGATWTRSATGNGTTGAKVAAKRKATPKKPAAESEAKSGEGESDTDREDKPTVKKAKARKAAPQKKGTAIMKDNKKATEVSASEGEANEDEQTAAASEEEA